MTAYEYITGLPHGAKRDYAQRYWDWLVDGGDERPEAEGITAAVAAGVRNRVTDIYCAWEAR